MDLKLVLHRTSIKSGKRSRVKNQSIKKDKFDATAKFPTSLNSSIYRDEDISLTKEKQSFLRHTIQPPPSCGFSHLQLVSELWLCN